MLFWEIYILKMITRKFHQQLCMGKMLQYQDHHCSWHMWNNHLASLHHNHMKLWHSQQDSAHSGALNNAGTPSWNSKSTASHICSRIDNCSSNTYEHLELLNSKWCIAQFGGSTCFPLSPTLSSFLQLARTGLFDLGSSFL